MVLDRHNGMIGMTGGAFPILLPFSLPILLYASLSEFILDEWGHSLHDVRKCHSAHWMPLPLCNKHRENFTPVSLFLVCIHHNRLTDTLANPCKRNWI